MGIAINDLGQYRGRSGRSLVRHKHPDCPYNACIEREEGLIRCWACRSPLTKEAVNYLRRKAFLTEHGTFGWK